MFENIPEHHLNNHGGRHRVSEESRFVGVAWRVAAVTMVRHESLLRRKSYNNMCERLGDILLRFEEGGTQKVPELFALLNMPNMSI